MFVNEWGNPCTSFYFIKSFEKAKESFMLFTRFVTSKDETMIARIARLISVEGQEIAEYEVVESNEIKQDNLGSD